MSGSSPYDAKPWLKHYDPWVSADIALPDTAYTDLMNEGMRIMPDRPAMIYFDRKISFSRLDDLSARFAAYLTDSGCGPGNVVGINLPNIPQYLVAFAGAMRAGCAVSGISFLLTAKEMAYQLRDAEVKTLVTLDSVFKERFAPIAEKVPALKDVVVANVGGFLPLKLRIFGRLLKKIPTGPVFPIARKRIMKFSQVLADFPPQIPNVKLSPDDVCLMQYTGGTTGRPKGAMLTHRNIVANTFQSRQWINVKPGDPEIGISAFPFFHLAGLMLGMMGLCSGFTQCLIPDPRETALICRLIKKYRPTIMANVPTLYQMLMDTPAFSELDFSNCRLCLSGAAPFAEESIRRLESIVGAGKVMEVYGMTETSPLLTMNPSGGKKKIGSVGIPIQSTRVKLVDTDTGTREVPVGAAGEVIARGPQVMAGYKGKPEETNISLREFEGEKWLFTGDVAKMDEEGYFTVVDRTKDMINVGGYKVFSREVEEVLYAHAMVDFCAVIGSADPERPGSERVKAVIQRSKAFEERDPADLKKEITDYCRKNMAPYKVPKIIEFVGAIPLTAVGKVDKKELRK